MVECDNCQKDAIEELAGGWLRLESIGPPLKLVTQAPQGGWHFCSMVCLGAAIDIIRSNIS